MYHNCLLYTSARKLIENYEVVIDDSDVEIPDYANLDKVLIELFLLDPEQCAACTYMLAAVEAVSYTHLDVYKRQVLMLSTLEEKYQHRIS